MKRVLLIVLLLFFAFPCFSETVHLVRLRDGRAIRGLITQQNTDGAVTIRRADNSIVVIPLANIASVDVIEDTTPIVSPAIAPEPPVNHAFPLALSLFFPIHGLGQFYNGDVKKGIKYIAYGIIGGGILSYGYNTHEKHPGRSKDAINTGVSILALSWIFSSVDAYKSAH